MVICRKAEHETVVFGHGLDGASSSVQKQAGQRGGKYSATCVCVRARGRACVREAVP